MLYPFESEDYNPFKYFWGIVKTIIRYYHQYISIANAKEKPTDDKELRDLMAVAIHKNPNISHFIADPIDSTR